MIKYQGSFYVKADPPAGVNQSLQTDPKNFLKKDDEKKPTKIEPDRKPKPLPYDPRIDRVKAKLEKKRERLDKLSFPIKGLVALIERYHLPSAQIFIRDLRTSKDRLLQNLDELLEDLEKLSPNNEEQIST
jgi:hypothetical protein